MQSVALSKRQDLPLQDLLSLAPNGTSRWLIEQAYQRGIEAKGNIEPLDGKAA